MKDENKDVKFWIHPDDFNILIAYASSAHTQFGSEIGGQLIVEEDKDGDFILKNPIILKQEVSGGECTLETEALTNYYSSHGSKVRHCWWHSHHTMAAFWSGTDNNCILDNPANDFSVSLVINLKREYKLRIQFFKPFLHEENIKLNFLKVETEKDAEIDKLVKQLCTKSVTSMVTMGHYKNGKQTTFDYGGYGYGYGRYNGSLEQNESYLNYNANLEKLPETVRTEILDKIEKIHDDIIEDGFMSFLYRDYQKEIQKLNQEFKKYGIKVKLLSESNLRNQIYALWPADYIIGKDINSSTYQHTGDNFI